MPLIRQRNHSRQVHRSPLKLSTAASWSVRDTWRHVVVFNTGLSRRCAHLRAHAVAPTGSQCQLAEYRPVVLIGLPDWNHRGVGTPLIGVRCLRTGRSYPRPFQVTRSGSRRSKKLQNFGMISSSGPVIQPDFSTWAASPLPFIFKFATSIPIATTCHPTGGSHLASGQSARTRLSFTASISATTSVSVRVGLLLRGTNPDQVFPQFFAHGENAAPRPPSATTTAGRSRP